MTGLWDYLKLTQVERTTIFILDCCRPSQEVVEICEKIQGNDEGVPEKFLVHTYDHDHHEDGDWVV